MFTEPTEAHAWLRRMVGAWAYEHECVMEPGGEPAMSSGREVVRAFGDLWVIGEGEGEAPDGTAFRSMITLGFDPSAGGGAGRYVGSFVATVMGGMFVYEGTREGDVLTLDTEGPSMSDASAMARYRDVVELVSEDVRRMSSRVLTEGGDWFTFMRGEYRREG
jgi:hypothetical protein